jgi:hypothetical protein
MTAYQWMAYVIVFVMAVPSVMFLLIVVLSVFAMAIHDIAKAFEFVCNRIRS